MMTGFVISFGIRCNVGIATVKMLANTTNEDGNVTALPEFNWSTETTGCVDSSFFWGYFVTQIPGGFLASRFSATRLFGMAIVLSSFLNLLIPLSISIDPHAVIVVRVLQGLVEGVTYPACHGIWSWWAPPQERSRLATLSFCGSYIGVVLGMPLSGHLTEWIGWEAPFYFYGCAGIFWFILWILMAYEKPSSHPYISSKEKIFIEESLRNPKVNQEKKLKIPCLKVRSKLFPSHV